MFNLTFVLIRRIFKSPGFWVSFVFLFFFLAFFPGAWSAEDVGEGGDVVVLKTQLVSVIISTALAMIIILGYSEGIASIKSTIIYQEIAFSKTPKWKFNFAKIFPIVLISLLFLSFALIITVIFDAVGLIGGSGMDFEKNVIAWSDAQGGYMFLGYLVLIVTTISICYFFETVTKSYNAFLSISWGYLFVVFFFGGASIPLILLRGNEAIAGMTYISYLIPNAFVNFFIADSFVGIINDQDTFAFLGYSELEGVKNSLAPLGYSAGLVGISMGVNKLRH